MKHTVFGVHINQRVKSVPAVQAVLTKYGCSIRMRLGIHDADATSCSPSGLLLIDAFGPEAEDFYKELAALEGVDVKRMDFED
jgi:hypothetical protein